MTDRGRTRLFVLRVLVLSLLLTLFGRLWYLQVLSGKQYAAAATANRTRELVTPAVRGLLVDDHGVPLVQNKAALVVTVNRAALPRREADRDAVLSRLSPIVGIPTADLVNRVTPCDYNNPDPKKRTPKGQDCNKDSPYEPVRVKVFPLGGSQAKASQQAMPALVGIRENPDDFPGVAVQAQALRDYPLAGAQSGTKLGAHLLGYIGPVLAEEVAKNPALHERDLVGRDGLERVYDRYLRGTPGVRVVGVNAAGDVNADLGTSPPTPGADVVLNVAAGIQRAAEQALQNALTRYAKTAAATDTHRASNPNPTEGSAVVMTTDGRVVALASTPSYDPSVFTNGLTTAERDALFANDGPKALLDRAVDGQYAPGSTWKAVSAAAALQNGLTYPGETLDCPPQLPIGDQVFRNFDGEPAGPVNLPSALEVSCDVIFDRFAYNAWQADGGLRNGAQKYPPAKEVFAATARAFGFGESTSIDLPGDAPGAIIDRKARYEQWAHGTGLGSKAYSCKRIKQIPPGNPEYKYASDACTDGGNIGGGEAAQFGIGQGSLILVTPLQLARAYAAVANGGKLYTPTLAKAIVAPDGSRVQPVTPRLERQVPVDPRYLDYIMQGLHQVTHGKKGTAAGVFQKFPVDVWGKTGTAEVKRIVNGSETDTETAWFASVGPPGVGGSPRYVIVVTVPDSGQGAAVAAPAARDIWSAIYGVQGGKVTNPGARPPTLLPCFDPRSGLTRAGTATCTASKAPRGDLVPAAPPAEAAVAAAAGRGLPGAAPPQPSEPAVPTSRRTPLPVGSRG